MWATCLTDFALFQACRCRICARHTTFAWIRQPHQHQPRGTAAFTNWSLGPHQPPALGCCLHWAKKERKDCLRLLEMVARRQPSPARKRRPRRSLETKEGGQRCAPSPRQKPRRMTIPRVTIPFIRGAHGRPQKKAKDEAKHRSSKDSSSSSEDMRTELFRDAASSGSWVNKIQRVAQESPGALLDSGLKAMRRFLDPRNHQGSGGRKQGLTPHVTQYLTTVVQALKGRELGLRSERELRTLSEALDHLLSGNLAACGDTLMQRFKAVELAGEAGWAVASRMELIPQSAVSAVPSEEREAALTLEGRERKLLGFADGLRKGKS